MKHAWQKYGVILSLILTAALSTRPVWAQDNDPATDAENDLARYKILVERNIFDPARRPPAPQREERPRPERRVDRLYLTGVLVSPEDQLAFFEGSRDEYFGAVNQGGKIAGFSVANVGLDRATLMREDRKVDLTVGTGLSRREGEDWVEASGLDFSRDSSATSPAVDSGESSDQTNRYSDKKEYEYRDKYNKDRKDAANRKLGGDAARLEMIRKMKERRMQELKK